MTSNADSARIFGYLGAGLGIPAGLFILALWTDLFTDSRWKLVWPGLVALAGAIAGLVGTARYAHSPPWIAPGLMFLGAASGLVGTGLLLISNFGMLFAAPWALLAIGAFFALPATAKRVA